MANTTSTPAALELKVTAQDLALASEMQREWDIIGKGGVPLIAEYSQRFAENHDIEPNNTATWPATFAKLLEQTPVWNSIPEIWRPGGSSHTRFLQASCVAGKMADLVTVCDRIAKQIEKDVTGSTVYMNDVRQKAMAELWKAVKSGKAFADAWAEKIATARTIRKDSQSVYGQVSKAKEKLVTGTELKENHSAGARAAAAAKAIRALFIPSGDVKGIILDDAAYSTLVKAQQVLVGLGVKDSFLTDVAKVSLPADLRDPESHFSKDAAAAAVASWRYAGKEDAVKKEEPKAEAEAEPKPATTEVSDLDPEFFAFYQQYQAAKKAGLIK